MKKGSRDPITLSHPRSRPVSALRVPPISGQKLQRHSIAPAKPCLHLILALTTGLARPLRIHLFKLHITSTYSKPGAVRSRVQCHSQGLAGSHLYSIVQVLWLFKTVAKSMMSPWTLKATGVIMLTI